jgi:hypothetical protein
MTTIRDNTRKPDPQGDDQTQPSKSPGEIEGGDDGTTEPQGQRGVTSPSQPGRRDRQDPNEYVGGSDDQHQGDDEDIPQPDPQRTGRGESQRREDVTE